jgi:pyruvate/2-oxoglutarate dehydrogenase complex dihydrolipoamide dehydrogenase (E3) component
MISKKKYDVVIVAVGAEPIVPRYTRNAGVKVFNVMDVYGNEKTLGKKVVMIGGDKIGTQTGMYLAEAGHTVTVLTNAKEVIPAEGAHQIIDTYLDMKNFHFKTEVTVSGIEGGNVTYADTKGKKRVIKADSVVVYAGFKPRLDEAMTFSDSADRFFIIGDCQEVGGYVRACTRTAFAAGSQI